MRRKILGSILLCALLLVLIQPGRASAHTTIQVGDYAVEYGWLNEPAVAGQPNAVVINISQTKGQATAGAEPTKAPGEASIDVSGLKIQAVYGGETKLLTLQPLGENTPGQFIAPMTPTRPGVYTVQLSGSLGSSPVNVSVQPEEIQTADTVQFPPAEASTGAEGATSANGSLDWLGIAGVVLGAIGTILGVLALTRKPEAR